MLHISRIQLWILLACNWREFFQCFRWLRTGRRSCLLSGKRRPHFVTILNMVTYNWLQGLCESLTLYVNWFRRISTRWNLRRSWSSRRRPKWRSIAIWTCDTRLMPSLKLSWQFLSMIQIFRSSDWNRRRYSWIIRFVSQWGAFMTEIWFPCFFESISHICSFNLFCFLNPSLVFFL